MLFVPGIEPPHSSSPEAAEGGHGAHAHEDAAVFFVVHTKGIVMRRHDDGVPKVLDAAEASTVAASDAEAHFLGQLDGRNVFAIGANAEIAAPFEVLGLRALYGAVDETVFGIAGRAVQIVDWALTHRFCGRCATRTERPRGERAMRCPACELSAYPRIAPAIIVLVRKGDLALLAHGARFPAPFYSTLAGFVEPGESLEETLVREVKEEVGIDVDDIRYFGSQSWPFPHSLMLGFFARWKSGEITPDASEIVDAKWFRADELPMIPPPLSISRKLIDVWLAEIRERAAQATEP